MRLVKQAPLSASTSGGKVAMSSRDIQVTRKKVMMQDVAHDGSNKYSMCQALRLCDKAEKRAS